MATQSQIVLRTFIANGLIKPGDMDFAKNLANYHKIPSPKQQYWIDKFIAQATNSTLPVKPVAAMATSIVNPPTVKIDLTKIVKMFDNAKQHLKFPKIWIAMKNGKSIRLDLKGPNSRYAGSISISDGRCWYGSIRPDGSMYFAHAGSQVKDDLVAVLEEFAKSPEEVAKKYGMLTSKCCFCHKALSTPESLAVGYGPDCADHYHLSWGPLKKSSTNILKVLSDTVNVLQDEEVPF